MKIMTNEFNEVKVNKKIKLIERDRVFCHDK